MVGSVIQAAALTGFEDNSSKHNQWKPSVGKIGPFWDFVQPGHTGSLWVDLFQNSKIISNAKIRHFLALVALKDTKKTVEY